MPANQVGFHTPYRRDSQYQYDHRHSPGLRTGLDRMTLSSLRSGYLPAAFSWAAQRRLTASEMRERPSEERTRFFFRSEAYGELTMTFRGRPTLAGALGPAEPGSARRARACVSRAISASMEERMSSSTIREL